MKPASEWRLHTRGGIPLTVLSRSGGFSKEEATATEQYLIPAQYLLAFALESLPRPITFLGSLIYPACRRLPGLASMVTKSIRWEPFDTSLPVDPFNSDAAADDKTYGEFVKVTIEYATNPNNDDDESDPDDPQTFLEVSANASGSFLAVPTRGNAKWDLGPWDPTRGLSHYGETTEPVTEVDIPQTVIQCEVEWSVRWPQIPYDFLTNELVARLRGKMGKVNSGKMELFHDAPPETIMFISWSMKQSHTWREGEVGRSPVELDMRFLEKNFVDEDGTQVTHQHVYRPGWGWMVMLVDDKKLYATTNLDQIFTS